MKFFYTLFSTINSYSAKNDFFHHIIPFYTTFQLWLTKAFSKNALVNHFNCGLIATT